jgi:hypothetical protein
MNPPNEPVKSAFAGVATVNKSPIAKISAAKIKILLLNFT